jgi:energy-coupling factor transport system ATP-binding protein
MCFTYSLGMPFETEVLKDINLEIDKGEFVGLIGVFQYPENQLFEETIYQEVAFGPKKLGLPEEKIEKRVREALKMVDLDYNLYVERSPFSLSGGEMRRVALASILSIRPKMLILDEPTANLDPQGRDNILSEIKKIHYNFGMTVVLVSHNMEKVAETVKRLLVMHRGEIIIDGAPQDIFEKRANDLMKVGLGLPQVTECMHKLKAKGKDVYTGVLTVDDAEREVLKKMKKPLKR